MRSVGLGVVEVKPVMALVKRVSMSRSLAALAYTAGRRFAALPQRPATIRDGQSDRIHAHAPRLHACARANTVQCKVKSSRNGAVKRVCLTSLYHFKLYVQWQTADRLGCSDDLVR